MALFITLYLGQKENNLFRFRTILRNCNLFELSTKGFPREASFR